MPSGTNNGGGARWHLMERATCPRCGLNRPVGVRQYEQNNECNNRDKCDARAAKRKQKTPK